MAVPSSTTSFPSSHSSGPITGVELFASALPAPMRLSAKLESTAVIQLMAKPLRPPPCSRKNATTGNAMKKSPAFRLLAGSRGISSGSSSNAANANVTLTRQRSGSG